MPRHDWRNDDDYMTREDRERGYGERDRAYDRRAMFDNDRDSYMRRGRASGWGSLLNDEGSGARDLDPRGRSEHAGIAASVRTIATAAFPRTKRSG